MDVKPFLILLMPLLLLACASQHGDDLVFVPDTVVSGTTSSGSWMTMREAKASGRPFVVVTDNSIATVVTGDQPEVDR
jgi:hypothetical protein